jgi:[ribosomal protein S18]-alanine N-acetyltransferase
MMSLQPNSPLDLATLGSLLADKQDLALVWPDARFPFDRDQWRATLTPRPGNRSFFVAGDGEIIGHAALLETEETGVLAVSYLYIRPEQRGQGLGHQLMMLIEAEAARITGTSALRLKVRTYNPRAAHLYEAAGYSPVQREDTLIIMRKQLKTTSRA